MEHEWHLFQELYSPMSPEEEQDHNLKNYAHTSRKSWSQKKVRRDATKKENHQGKQFQEPTVRLERTW
jgi:hypothetical protein